MLFCGFLSGAGLNQVASTVWDGTKSFPGGEQSSIPHLKEEIQGFHMNPKTALVIGDFWSKLLHNILSRSYLVVIKGIDNLQARYLLTLQ